MKKIKFAVALLAVSAVLNSCVKTKYDTPLNTSLTDPHLTVNLNISDLSAIAINLGANGSRTMGDSTIYGIVTADDRSGNFYKEIIIQDSTGGIAVAMNQSDLYTNYAIGRKVYIKLNGLTIVNYKGLPELAYSVSTNNGSFSTNGIPSAFIPNTVIPASYPNTVTPVDISLLDASSGGSRYLNLLVTIHDVEFQTSSANVVYASPSLIAPSTTRYLQDCPSSGASLEVYNSGYADFQPVLTPNGKGTITGIYSIYGSYAQFLIRDTSDVRMNGNRDCP